MTDPNRQAVKDMLAQVRARLIDLEEAIDTYPGDLAGYDTRLDRIDDRIYLLEVELEKRAAAINRGEEVPPANQNAAAAAGAKAGKTAADVADKAIGAASKAASTAASAVTSFAGALSSSLNESAASAPRAQDADTASRTAPAAEAPAAPSPVPQGTSDPTGDPQAAVEAQAAEKSAAATERDEQMRATVRDLNVIYQEGRETLGSLSDALADIREPFDKLSSALPRGTRRRW